MPEVLGNGEWITNVQVIVGWLSKLIIPVLTVYLIWRFSKDIVRWGVSTYHLGKNGLEFLLVVLFLFFLTALFCYVLHIPAHTLSGGLDQNGKNVLDYKMNLISWLIALFSLWIGAGSSYFFGRESYREAISRINEIVKSNEKLGS